MSQKDIKSLTIEELKGILIQNGFKPFRAKQIFTWLHRGVTDFSQMTDISKKEIEILKEEYYINTLKIERKLCSKTDGTVKYLFKLRDGEFVESVFMKYKHGNSVCISTQVGCRMGCKFCASTLGGKIRDLAPSEMLDQVLKMRDDTGESISNIVLMGMGEPLDNYENVLKFLHIVNCSEGINIGMRHISLSTCGLVDKIYDLLEENLQLTLSVSLHAPNDTVRKNIMPIANKWSMDELLRACKIYGDKTGRRISFEYTVINGVNDRKEDAEELARRLKGILCHVNLIPVNPVKERNFRPGNKENIIFFCKLLKNLGICATIRRTLGEDIDASCGQLRQKTVENHEKGGD